MNDSPTASQRPAAGEPVARLDGVAKRYGDIVALDGVDLTIEAGEAIALLGPNGAGKTTTVNLLLGLIRPSAGAVTTFGCPPRAMAARLRVGAMLQISKVPETLSVEEHVTLTSSYYPRPLPIAKTLRLAGLEGLERRLYGKLSGGQKQRALFALAVCGDPDLLFLDEPTVGLDVEARREPWGCVRRMVAGGKTVLLTTHHLEEADALASRVVVIDRGRVVAEGAPASIKARTHGRRIRCRTSLEATTVAAWPGIDDLRIDGDRLEILAVEAEAVVSRLLDADPELRELEVTSAGLEEALLALTHKTGPDREVAA